jgi:hypothetical protein
MNDATKCFPAKRVKRDVLTGTAGNLSPETRIDSEERIDSHLKYSRNTIFLSGDQKNR